jgi:hypothetical protein
MSITESVQAHSVKPSAISADVMSEESMSTRSTIWSGESEGKSLHIYWELADRETEHGGMSGTPIYIAVDAGNADEEVAIRLPKEIAVRILTILSSLWADRVGSVISRSESEGIGSVCFRRLLM